MIARSPISLANKPTCTCMLGMTPSTETIPVEQMLSVRSSKTLPKTFLCVVDKFLTAIAEPVGPILSNMAGSMDATVAQDPTKDADVAGSFLSAAFPSLGQARLERPSSTYCTPTTHWSSRQGSTSCRRVLVDRRCGKNGLQEIEQTFQ